MFEGIEVYCYYGVIMKVWFKCFFVCKYNFLEGDWIYRDDDDLFGIFVFEV